ncbi:hypothetical protein ACFWB0_17550 [Rhodococcus sp. NPDC060086]
MRSAYIAVAITGAPPCGAEVIATAMWQRTRTGWHLAEIGGLPTIVGTVP